MSVVADAPLTGACFSKLVTQVLLPYSLRKLIRIDRFKRSWLWDSTPPSIWAFIAGWFGSMSSIDILFSMTSES